MASAPPTPAPGIAGLARSWIDRNFLDLGREMRSYRRRHGLRRSGIAGLTSIIAVFYIRSAGALGGVSRRLGFCGRGH
jgi:hypothetical protein